MNGRYGQKRKGERMGNGKRVSGNEGAVRKVPFVRRALTAALAFSMTPLAAFAAASQPSVPVARTEASAAAVGEGAPSLTPTGSETGVGDGASSGADAGAGGTDEGAVGGAGGEGAEVGGGSGPSNGGGEGGSTNGAKPDGGQGGGSSDGVSGEAAGGALGSPSVPGKEGEGDADASEDASDAPSEDDDAEPSSDAAKPDDYVVEGAADMPAVIEAGETYVLANDIVLDADQQIASIDGVLDGRGHTVTLAGKPLADTVTGTVQNLGVAGSAAVDAAAGAIAQNFSGTIQTCFVTAKVTSSDFMVDPAGFVGNMTGGVIRNAYFAGDAGFGSAFVSGGTVANLSHTVAAPSGALGNVVGVPSSGQNLNDCHKVGDYGDAVASWADALSVLNAELPETGFSWAALAGSDLPLLQEGDAAVNRSALDAAIAEADALSPEGWTDASWAALEEALAAAKAVAPDADQPTVDAAAKALRDALSALEKERPSEPVALPDDGSVIDIATAADFAAIDGDTKGAFYRLTSDITLTAADYCWLFGTFDGVLDGQGHTVTLDGKARLFDFAELGASGVVQNVRFKGSGVGGQGAEGVLGSSLEGAVLNCSFDVATGEGLQSSGIAKTLDGGTIANCYVIGSPQNAFVSAYSAGRIVDSYWMDSLNNAVPSAAMESCEAKSGAAMRTLEFAAQMNANRGAHGVQWGQNSDGYPYFGPDLPYTEPGTEPSKHDVSFAPQGGGAAHVIEGGVLTIDRASVDQFQFAGVLSLPDYTVPEGCTLEWNSTHDDIRCTLDTGELYAGVVGEAVITADLRDASGAKLDTLATVKVVVVEADIEAIKLFVDGEDVTNGTLTLAGSEEATIEVRAKVAGADGFRPVNSSLFTYESRDDEFIYKEPQYASFHFEKPGTAAVEVVYRANPDVSATVTATSTYVAAQSVKPGIEGTFTVHGRNANDWQNHPPNFNPDYAKGAVVEPANASYADRAFWKVESSDPSVGVYSEGAFAAVSAGKVTYTTTLTEPNGRTVSGSSEVEYRYQNPLTDVSVGDATVSLPKNEKRVLDLTFAGARDAEGWSISEPSLNWEYSEEGVVAIYRDGVDSYRKIEEGAPDNGQFVVPEEYTVEALSEGTVTVVGTPVDQTAGAEPIELTITVTPGEDLPAVDVDALTSDGAKAAAQNLIALHAERGYAYGDEWDVLTLLRSGHEISQADLNAYYWSVVEEVRSWQPNQKATDIERVALTLTAMGKDITDIEGMNVAAMVYDHPSLPRQGYNAVIFALVTIDAALVEPPTGATWTRSALLTALLAAQHADGGFGLTADGASGIDITAMALQALAPYRAMPNVEGAIEKAVAYLADQLMKPQYAYSTSEAQSQTIVALAALGIDPLKAGFGDPYRNVFSSFMDLYAKGDGGFSTVPNGPVTAMSTAQALQAFEAYQRYAAGEAPFWQLSDMPEKPTEPVPPEGEKPDGQGGGNGDGGNGGNSGQTPPPADTTALPAGGQLGGATKSLGDAGKKPVAGTVAEEAEEESLWDAATARLAADGAVPEAIAYAADAAPQQGSTAAVVVGVVAAVAGALALVLAGLARAGVFKRKG